MQFTGRGHLLIRRNLALAAGPSIVVGLLGLTNEVHSLIWAQPGLDPAGYPGLVAGRGIMFSIYALLNYGYLLVGTTLFIVEYSRATPVYRRQVGILAAASFIPLAGNAITLAGLLPGLRLDATQISLPLAGAVFAFGLFRVGRWNLAPVAARAVIDNLPDAVIVLDDVLRPAEVWRRYAGAAEAQTELELSGEGGEGGRSFQLTITPLRDRHGSTFGRVALVRDISDERALLKMRDDLTHMLIHDLRNPFSAIHSALQLISTLLGEGLPEAESDHDRPLPRAAAVQGAIGIALNSSTRAQEMLDSLLDLNQLEGGQMPVAAEPVETGLFVRTVARDLQPEAERRGLTLALSIPDDLPEASADPDLFDRVLHNLVGNAIKFTPAGGCVTVSVRGEDGCLALSVSDTGPGIPPQVLSRLFQKFVRGPGQAHGSGLGLAFCKLAVEAMGGRIWAESPAAEGATFHFTLPRADSSDT
jgi:signal transduction histidine kinase